MNGFTKDSSTTILINEAVKKHKSIVPSMLDAHALVGCDSVPKLFGIAKIKVINALKFLYLYLEILSHWKLNTWIIQNAFIARCYGVDKKNSSENGQVICF